MKSLLPVLLIMGVMLAGCATSPKDQAAGHPGDTTAAGAATGSSTGTPAEAPKLIVTPGSAVAGTVAAYNDAGNFVVVDFPYGQMPVTEQRLFVYRGGLKIGEVKITGPQKETRTVADLLQGEARKGDDVRDK